MITVGQIQIMTFKNPQSTIKCFISLKRSHKAKSCPEGKTRNAKDDPQRNIAMLTISLSVNKNSVNEKCLEWTLDSAYTKHMSISRESFIEI